LVVDVLGPDSLPNTGSIFHILHVNCIDLYKWWHRNTKVLNSTPLALNSILRFQRCFIAVDDEAVSRQGGRYNLEDSIQRRNIFVFDIDKLLVFVIYLWRISCDSRQRYKYWYK